MQHYLNFFLFIPARRTTSITESFTIAVIKMDSCQINQGKDSSKLQMFQVHGKCEI